MKTIFLIEDDEDIRVIVERILSMREYNVITAVNGQDALRVLKTGLVPHLILLDLMMPVMDGAEFRRQQRELFPQLNSVPLLVMSADGQIQQKLKNFSASGYIKKPMDLDNFLQVIQNFIDSPPTISS